MLEKIFVMSIFILTYYFIIFGKFQRSAIVFLMGLIVALTKFVEGMKIHRIGEFIDMNTIGLLLGMMIIVGVLKKTGFFQYAAIKVIKAGGSDFWRLTVRISMLVAIFSAFLDNVTTILLFSPILFLLLDTVEVDPTPFLFLIVISSNIGGTATMIGDPPNILVGSASGIGFLKFMLFMAPPSIIAFFATLWLFKKRFLVITDVKEKLERVSFMEPEKAITDKKLLKRVIWVFVGVIFFFTLHEILDYEMAMIALTGATLVVILSGESFESISSSIEWDTIFFFAGLFMIAYALEEVGIISLISKGILAFSKNVLLLKIIFLWISGLTSSFIGAVPTVSVMIPVVRDLVSKGLPETLWFALALGASFGGIGTMTGTASSIVGIGLLEGHIKRKIGYIEYLKIGFPVMVLCNAISTLYIVLLHIVMRG